MWYNCGGLADIGKTTGRRSEHETNKQNEAYKYHEQHSGSQ